MINVSWATGLCSSGWYDLVIWKRLKSQIISYMFLKNTCEVQQLVFNASINQNEQF